MHVVCSAHMLLLLQRIVLVDDPALGYKNGILEIPAGATFELKVEVLRT